MQEFQPGAVIAELERYQKNAAVLQQALEENKAKITKYSKELQELLSAGEIATPTLIRSDGKVYHVQNVEDPDDWEILLEVTEMAVYQVTSQAIEPYVSELENLQESDEDLEDFWGNLFAANGGATPAAVTEKLNSANVRLAALSETLRDSRKPSFF